MASGRKGVRLLRGDVQIASLRPLRDEDHADDTLGAPADPAGR